MPRRHAPLRETQAGLCNEAGSDAGTRRGAKARWQRQAVAATAARSQTGRSDPGHRLSTHPRALPRCFLHPQANLPEHVFTDDPHVAHAQSPSPPDVRNFAARTTAPGWRRLARPERTLSVRAMRACSAARRSQCGDGKEDAEREAG
eukprot:2604567-Pleurochrysis_carterae.AAC.6